MPDKARTARIAFELWDRAGRPEGQDAAFWAMARKVLPWPKVQSLGSDDPASVWPPRRPSGGPRSAA